MLSERPYLRGDYPRETTSVVTWLICAVAGAFLLQFIAVSSWGPPAREAVSQFAFSMDGLAAGRVWTLLTHWLLHSTGNLFHVGLVLAGLYLLGRELQPALGSRRFSAVFAAGILIGALAWGAVNGRPGGTLMGATAGIYALVAAHALLHPNRAHSLLLFFFFPVTFRPKQLAIALLCFDVIAVVVVDLLGRALPFSYAPSAHLGGMMAGWACFRVFQQLDQSAPVSHRHSAPRQAGFAEASTAESVAQEKGEEVGSSREQIRRELDRILDKINSQGFAALTPEERRILDDAKELLNKR